MNRSQWATCTSFLSGGAVVGALTAARRAVERWRGAPHSDGQRPWAFPTEHTHDIVTDDGARLRVVECGAGPPVLLLHGFGLSADIWTLLAQNLRDANFRVIALDQRGFGRSCAPSADFALDELVADVDAVLDHLGLFDVILIGQSMGGVITQAYALQAAARRRPRALVLMNTTCNLARDPRNRLLAAALDSALATRLSAIGPLGLLIARGTFGRRPVYRHVELTVRVGAAGNAENRRGLVGRLLGTDLTERLASLTIPTLILAGEADRVTPMAATRQLAGAISHAQVVSYPGAGHSLMLERSREIATEIANFVARIQNPATTASPVRQRPPATPCG